MAMTDIEVKKVEYMGDKKTEAERDMWDAADKVKAVAKAIENKIRGRDLNAEYTFEKAKKMPD